MITLIVALWIIAITMSFAYFVMLRVGTCLDCNRTRLIRHLHDPDTKCKERRWICNNTENCRRYFEAHPQFCERK